MTAHIAMRCLDGQDAPPATLSPHIMTDILRDSLGFRGITVTDALTMAAVVRKYGPGETAVRAFLAGSDLLLMPANIDAAVNAMLTAVAEGRITLDRIDQSVRRMLELKFGAGVFAKRTVALDSIPLVVGQRAHQKVADDIAERALTLVQRGGIDDFRSQNGRITVIAYAEVANRRMGNDMAKALRDHGNSVSTFRLYPSSGPMSYDSAQTLIERNGRVVFATSVRPISGRGHIDLPEALANLITETDGRKPTILVSFGSPYLLDQLERYDDAYLLAWNPVEATEKAAAAVVAGHAATIGRLPITLSETHPRGHGVILFPR